MVKQRSMCPEKRDIIEKQEHIFGKKTQFKIKLTCIILNLTILFSKFSYFARFQVNFCLIINLLILAWYLKFLSLKIVVFFFYFGVLFTIYWFNANNSMAQALFTQLKNLWAVYLAYNFKIRQSNICWSSEMPYLSIGSITIRKKVWHISWQCHFKIVRNDYQSSFFNSL